MTGRLTFGGRKRCYRSSDWSAYLGGQEKVLQDNVWLVGLPWRTGKGVTGRLTGRLTLEDRKRCYRTKSDWSAYLWGQEKVLQDNVWLVSLPWRTGKGVTGQCLTGQLTFEDRKRCYRTMSDWSAYLGGQENVLQDNVWLVGFRLLSQFSSVTMAWLLTFTQTITVVCFPGIYDPTSMENIIQLYVGLLLMASLTEWCRTEQHRTEFQLMSIYLTTKNISTNSSIHWKVTNSEKKNIKENFP